MLTLTSGLEAKPDRLMMKLRVYEGEREDVAARGRVTSTYYIKPMFAGRIFLEAGLTEEKEEIKKIFNLNDLRLLNQIVAGLDQSARDSRKNQKKLKRTEIFRMDGIEFLVKVGVAQAEDSFLLMVEDKKGGKKAILETEFLLPQQKTSVFGFESSEGIPYFITIQRDKDLEIDSVEPLSVKSIRRPRLIRKVNPVYPEEALKAKVQGIVKLEAVADVYGRVVELNVLSGPPLLRIASIDAVRRWVYEPYIIDGKPKPVKFTVMLRFRLDDDSPDLTAKDKTTKIAEGKLTAKQLLANIKNKKYSGEPLDLVFKNAKLEDVLKLFSDTTGIAFKIKPGLEKKVTCDLQRTPWDKALDEILKSCGTTAQLHGDAVLIVKKK
jgi:hypothetical protein